MATIEQVPGALDLSFVAGDDYAFTASFVGDISAYTHAAYIHSDGRTIATFTVTDTFSSPNTVVSFSLTDTQTAAMPSTPLAWAYTQDNAGSVRTILAGSVSVIKR